MVLAEAAAALISETMSRDIHVTVNPHTKPWVATSSKRCRDSGDMRCPPAGFRNLRHLL